MVWILMDVLCHVWLCGSGDDFINPRSFILFYQMSFETSGEEGKLMKSLHADGQKNWQKGSYRPAKKSKNSWII